MTFRSETCKWCGGSGEVVTAAHKSGWVTDGGFEPCFKCKGSGREVFQVTRPEPQIEAAVKKIEEQFKGVP